MKKIGLILALAIASLNFQACSENKKSGSTDSVENANDANDEKEKQATGEDDDDNEFAVKAANGGMLEMELARLVREKGQRSDVKEFAAMMMADHQKANDELKAIAGRKNITLPARLGDDEQKHVDELAKLSGTEFDKKYVDLMVDDHEKDVKLFKEAADDADDADLKAFAAKTLLTLQKHLERIKMIEKNID
jgi:putative membrane protein